MKDFKSYSEYANYPVSEKITLTTVDCKQRVYGFTLHASNIYKKNTALFVSSCSVGDSALARAYSLADMGVGKFYYDVSSSILYVYSTTSFNETESDPEIIATYRFFFSNIPVNLPWNFITGSEEVHWEGRVGSVPEFTTKLDNDQTGISVTGSGTLKLNNGDFYFSDFFDLYNFENQEVSVYSYHRSLPAEQAKIIYRGSITDKTYNSKEVTFKIKDDIYKLNESIPLGNFGDISDSVNVTEDVAGYVKRRIYGRVKDIKVQSVDMLYDKSTGEESFTLTYPISTTIKSRIVTGGNFLKELCVNDSITIGEETYSVDTIISDSKIVLSEEVPLTFTGTVLVTPDKSYYNKNRKFLICGHSLGSLSTTITKVYERNRIQVASTDGFEVGDYIDVNGQHIAIKRISNGTLITASNIADPKIGDAVSRDVVQNARVFDSDQKNYITLNRSDYTVSETVNGTYLTLAANAEINATQAKTLSGNYYVLNNYDMVWLGVPTILRYVCPANTSGSLYGKYFSIYTDSIESVFWFNEKLDSDLDAKYQAPTFSVSLASTAFNTTTDTITLAAHGLSVGQKVAFTSPPGGLVDGYSYYVRNVTTDTFQVSADLESSIKDITSQGSGSTMLISKDTFEIVLPSANMTASEVAVAVSDAVLSEMETYLSNIKSESIYFYSKVGGNLAVGSPGTSGITTIKLIQGSSSDQNINLTKKVNSRDFISIDGDNDTKWYEVLDVYNSSLRLREAYVGQPGLYNATVKNVMYADNESNVFVDTTGKLLDGKKILRASDVVKDLLLEAGLSDRLDLASFSDSYKSIPYTLSLKIPKDISDTAPTLKDVIDDINQSVLGSVVLTGDLKIAYNTVDAERTQSFRDSLPLIADDDIYSYSVKSVVNSYKEVVTKYRFTDLEEESLEYRYISDFSKKYSNSRLTLELDMCLYDLKDVTEASQRRLFYNSLSRSDIEISGGLSLYKYEMGDKVAISFKGLFNRLGNNNSNKLVCTVSSIKRSGESVDLTLTTTGGAIYSKVGVITSDTANDIATSSEDERLYSSYIVANNGTINNREDLHACNCIA